MVSTKTLFKDNFQAFPHPFAPNITDEWAGVATYIYVYIFFLPAFK